MWRGSTELKVAAKAYLKLPESTRQVVACHNCLTAWQCAQAHGEDEGQVDVEFRVGIDAMSPLAYNNRISRKFYNVLHLRPYSLTEA